MRVAVTDFLEHGMPDAMGNYDVCVIGGGPAGYAAAMRAVDFGKRVLLVERDRIGGAGVFNGALSSKALWELSREFAAYGRRFGSQRQGGPKIEFPRIAAEVNEAVRERSGLLLDHLRRVQQQHPDRLDYVQGTGRLTGLNRVEIATAAGPRSVVAANIVLATGSRPRTLPAVPVDERIIMTSDGIGSLEDFPGKLVILGAGVIGCEFATVFANFGRTEVHLIDKEPRILPFEDEDVAVAIERNLERSGVLIHRQCRLVSMGIVAGQVEYVLEHADHWQERFVAERALISVGRVPNIEHLGVEELGLKCNGSGHPLDDDTRTSLANVYAVGDLTADIALVNVGELEGRHAVEHMFGKPQRALAYDNISTIMFLTPETAGVGMNEIQAKKRGLHYRVASYSFECIPRAVAMRKTEGFFKILVTDDAEMKILGMRALGEHASSAIQAVALLISMGKGIEELAELIHPHPSIIEGIQECVRMLLGKSILKPAAFAKQLVCRRYAEGRYEPLYG
jgi:dihydrolipoamide dehydrogenase